MTEEDIVRLLNDGEIVAVPTDTVFGLIAIPTEKNAEKIFNLKKRPSEKPLGIFLPLSNHLKDYITFDYLRLKPLLKFWPGPLTLVLPVKEDVFPFIQKNGKIGFRIPDTELLLKILEITGPLIQTSANVSGEKIPVTSKEVRNIFGDSVYIVEGVSGELASTVLEYENGTYYVLRKGAIPPVKIKIEAQVDIKMDSLNLIFMCTGNTERSPMAEAMARDIFKGLKVNIRSRGVMFGGAPFSKMAQETVKELGYTPIEGKSRQISEDDLIWADMVLVMEKRHIDYIKEEFPAFSDKVFLFGDDDIPDPVGLGKKTHELVGKIIEITLKNRWLDFIKSLLK